MLKIKTMFKKTWIFVVAAAAIAGSSYAMAYALNDNTAEIASVNSAPLTTVSDGIAQTQAPETEITAEYSVTDLSKNASGQRNLIIDKLKRTEDITPEEIEQRYNEIIAMMTPADKDISAEQAAAYAADILKKAYAVDFTGYTAQASFSKNPLPNTDNWTVIFHAPKEEANSKRYIASVDSVNGRMLDAGCYNLDFRENADRNPDEFSENLNDPQWLIKAEQAVSVLMPENVSITGSKVVFAAREIGVTTVCNLSDGSAISVRLAGKGMEAAAYVYFPNGYDGSLDAKPLSENGVG